MRQTKRELLELLAMCRPAIHAAARVPATADDITARSDAMAARGLLVMVDQAIEDKPWPLETRRHFKKRGLRALFDALDEHMIAAWPSAKTVAEWARTSSGHFQEVYEELLLWVSDREEGGKRAVTDAGNREDP